MNHQTIYHFAENCLILCRAKSKRRFWSRSLVALAGALMLVTGGCQSSGPQPRTVELGWTVPENFPSFGFPAPDSIRVAVVGRSFSSPGYYYLRQGATVRDAMAVARFSGFAQWTSPISGIRRQNADGSTSTHWFGLGSRADDELTVLQEGDILRVTHTGR